jgi:High potential iron-sulfur protein
MSLSRRAFIENGAVLIAVIGVCDAAWSAASADMLSESDPTAVALGYKANASSVDKAKFAQYASGQSCSNCALYQGAAGSSSGPCPIFAGKTVSAQGWCASYAKKG